MARPKSKFKIYDTMAQFCEGEGIHISLAKRAKDANCPHVKSGGRFDSRAAQWIRDQAWDELNILDKEKLECERIEKQNRKLDFEHQVKLGQYAKIDEIKAIWSKAMEAVMETMKKLMTREDYNAAIKQIRANIKALDL